MNRGRKGGLSPPTSKLGDLAPPGCTQDYVHNNLLTEVVILLITLTYWKIL